MKLKSIFGIFLCSVLFLKITAQAAERVTPPSPQPLPRTSGSMNLDGELDDPIWKEALVIDRFYETSPGDNIPAKAKTTAYVTYDDDYFYIGIKADDPDPKKIRAPYVERDQVIGTDDNIAVFLDTRNDKRSAIELRVNPRGIQADGIFDDTNQSEDFSPDYFYDTAAKLTPEGWQAEFRIPMTTLRYPKTDPQTWRILIWRNYPRDFRYAFYSAPIPRGSNCYICHTHELTNINRLPSSRHLVVAPFATASELWHRRDPNDLDSSFTNDPVDGDFGVDVKWNPTANSAIDATIQPDFSQVESDVPQIATNQRFALFFPEKRPFFLEGSDLFNSPIQMVYTRTITNPQWGLRATGKMGDFSYTVLSSKDEGGGLVVIPGPTFSAFALQDFKSFVSLGRLRRDFGSSFGSFLFSDREISGGGHNRVFGPDGQWRPTDSDIVTGQFLYSDTENPDRPELSPFFDGAQLKSHAAHVNWNHQKRKYDWRIQYNDLGDEFRADTGFVPQVGFREVDAAGGFRFYPSSGPLAFIRTYAVADKFFLQNGDNLGHDYFPGIFLIGSRNLNSQIEFHNNEVKVGDQLLTQNYLSYFVQFDPSRRLPRITFFGRTGDLIDFDNGRVGNGANFGVQGTVRPWDNLTLTGDATREWLNLNEPDASGRLYTASIARLKAVYVFNARSFVRLIGQYVTTERDPSLYTLDVPKRDGSFLGSVLYGYRLNWQTVFFVGYGDNGIVTESNSRVRTNRSLFLKISYAWQQ
ncbi:carbohydrate binding family 9 domain-containing protein [bacterium]|nr:carbohydrate binding family 9 domain-containing protein [bacterium]MCI0602718.1 carbohydrate binding family 9 domain-containing protein [bacterium]